MIGRMRRWIALGVSAVLTVLTLGRIELNRSGEPRAQGGGANAPIMDRLDEDGFAGMALAGPLPSIAPAEATQQQEPCRFVRLQSDGTPVMIEQNFARPRGSGSPKPQ